MADPLIEDGRIKSIGDTLPDEGADVRQGFDATLDVTPRFIDLQVIFASQAKNTKRQSLRGAAAAVAGGFTSISAMPNTLPRERQWRC